MITFNDLFHRLIIIINNKLKNNIQYVKIKQIDIYELMEIEYEFKIKSNKKIKLKIYMYILLYAFINDKNLFKFITYNDYPLYDKIIKFKDVNDLYDLLINKFKCKFKNLDVNKTNNELVNYNINDHYFDIYYTGKYIFNFSKYRLINDFDINKSIDIDLCNFYFIDLNVNEYNGKITEKNLFTLISKNLTSENLIKLLEKIYINTFDVTKEFDEEDDDEYDSSSSIIECIFNELENLDDYPFYKLNYDELHDNINLYDYEILYDNLKYISNFIIRCNVKEKYEWKNLKFTKIEEVLYEYYYK